MNDIKKLSKASDNTVHDINRQRASLSSLYDHLKDVIRCRRFHLCMYQDGSARAGLRALCKDAFSDLALLCSQLIILIKFLFLLNKLTNITKHDFNSMFHKIMSVKEITYT